MNGWSLGSEPVMAASQLALIVLVLLQVRRALKRVRRVAPGRGSTEGPRERAVAEDTIVGVYNDALLAGWPAGEMATMLEVARRVGTSRRHVERVVAGRS